MLMLDMRQFMCVFWGFASLPVCAAVTLSKRRRGDTVLVVSSCLSLTFSVQDFLQDVATKTVPDPLHPLLLALRRQGEKNKKRRKRKIEVCF